MDIEVEISHSFNMSCKAVISLLIFCLDDLSIDESVWGGLESPPILVLQLVSPFMAVSICLGRRQWHPTPVLLPGKPHGRRSLVGCSSWGHKELDMTERLHFHFSLSCAGEGTGNPLLKNPRDRGAWWAAVYGVAQSRTRLKRLSSSSICLIY